MKSPHWVVTSGVVLFRTQVLSPISSELTPFSESLQWFLQLQTPIIITCWPQLGGESNRSANKSLEWVFSVEIGQVVGADGLAWVRTLAIVSRGRDRSNPTFGVFYYLFWGSSSLICGQKGDRVASRQNCARSGNMDKKGQKPIHSHL